MTNIELKMDNYKHILGMMNKKDFILEGNALQKLLEGKEEDQRHEVYFQEHLRRNKIR
jgi:CCR4-NOT transcriptional regulation complex NOT5 subunit